MRKRYLTHLELKQTGEHRYFGSVGSMFSIMKVEGIKLGVAIQTLYNYWHSQNKEKDSSGTEDITYIPYENSRCIIRRAPIEQYEKGRDNSKIHSTEE